MAPDALLSGNDREEALSWAYVRAVAAFAGYTLSAPDYDRDGIDLRIHAGGELSPSVGLQLKATTRLGPPQPDGAYRYPVPVRDYNRLVRQSYIPRYLVILALPEDAAQWLSVSAAELVMRRCAYWVSLRGERASSNRVSETVRVPPDNLFDPTALRRMLDGTRQEMRRLRERSRR